MQEYEESCRGAFAEEALEGSGRFRIHSSDDRIRLVSSDIAKHLGCHALKALDRDVADLVDDEQRGVHLLALAVGRHLITDIVKT